MNLWTAHFAASREAVQRRASSRKFVSASITRSPASDVRRSLKLPESVSLTNVNQAPGYLSGAFFLDWGNWGCEGSGVVNL